MVTYRATDEEIIGMGKEGRNHVYISRSLLLKWASHVKEDNIITGIVANIEKY